MRAPLQLLIALTLPVWLACLLVLGLAWVFWVAAGEVLNAMHSPETRK